MKIEKNIYIYGAVVVVIVGGLIFWMGRGDNTTDTSTASPSPEQSLNPSKTPELSNNKTFKPTPTLIKEIVGDYSYWVDLLEPLNRRITLDENCTSSVPSQVAYPNNVKIMIDNTLSAEPRVLRIGDKDYPVEARGWILTVLSRSELPAQLKMFCGSMELGQLDLE